MDIAATVVVLCRAGSSCWFSLSLTHFFLILQLLDFFSTFIPISDCLSKFICLLSPIFYFVARTQTQTHSQLQKLLEKIKQPFVNASFHIE